MPDLLPDRHILRSFLQEIRDELRLLNQKMEKKWALPLLSNSFSLILSRIEPKKKEPFGGCLVPGGWDCDFSLIIIIEKNNRDDMNEMKSDSWKPSTALFMWFHRIFQWVCLPIKKWIRSSIDKVIYHKVRGIATGYWSTRKWLSNDKTGI